MMNYCPKLPNDKRYDMMKYGMDDSDCESMSSDIEVYDKECAFQIDNRSDSSVESFQENGSICMYQVGEPRVSLKSKCSDIGENGKVILYIYSSRTCNTHRCVFSMKKRYNYIRPECIDVSANGFGMACYYHDHNFHHRRRPRRNDRRVCVKVENK